MQCLSVLPAIETRFDHFSAIVTLLATTNLYEVYSRLEQTKPTSTPSTVWILMGAPDILMFCIMGLNFASISDDRRVGLPSFKPITISPSVFLLNQLRFVCRGPGSNVALVKQWKFVSKMSNRLSISMQASVTRYVHLSFSAYWVLDVLPTSLLRADILVSPSATFVVSFSGTSKAPDDACFHTIELACLETFEVPSFIDSKYLSKDIVC